MTLKTIKKYETQNNHVTVNTYQTKQKNRIKLRFYEVNFVDKNKQK